MRPKDRGEKEGRRNSRSRSDVGGLPRRTRYIKAGEAVDFRDYELLRKFMTERGKVMPRRFTGASAKQQRQIRQAIRRARVMGLLP